MPKKASFKNKSFLSSFQTNKLGIIMLLDKNINILEETIIIPGRALFIKIELNKKIYNIFGIYAPAEASDKRGIDFFREILEFMNNIQSMENSIFLGDFNVDLEKSKKGGTANILKEILDKFSLTDTATLAQNNCNRPLSTWHGKGRRCNQSSRIDYIFSNLNIANLSFFQCPSMGDHDFISLTFKYNLKSVIKTIRCKDSILMDKESYFCQKAQ